MTVYLGKLIPKQKLSSVELLILLEILSVCLLMIMVETPRR